MSPLSLVQIRFVCANLFHAVSCWPACPALVSLGGQAQIKRRAFLGLGLHEEAGFDHRPGGREGNKRERKRYTEIVKSTKLAPDAVYTE